MAGLPLGDSEQIAAVQALAQGRTSGATGAQASEASLLQQVLHYSHDAIIGQTLTGRVSAWNPAAERLFGYGVEEMRGLSMDALLPPDRREEESFFLQRIVLGEVVQGFATQRVCRDGSTLQVTLTLVPVHDAAKNLVGVLQIARDMTQQVLMQESESRFHALVEGTDDAIISKTTDGIVTSWNPAAARMFGYNAEEMLGRPIQALIPADRRSEETLILQQIRRGVKVDHYETVRLHKSGRPVQVSVTISPIRDSSGAIVGASKIARDISEQKRAQARLQLTASVFANANEAVAITDVHGHIVEVNPAFTRITGYTHDEVIGRHPRAFASSRHGPELELAILDALQEKGHYRGEVWSRRRDGSTFCSLLSASVVRDAADHVQNYIAQFFDLTSMRAKQEQIEHIAHYDALTDLPNRHLLMDRLGQAVALARRSGLSMAVLYLDLDGFKQINDSYGHAMGDELLVAVARRMKAALREMDTLARMGGDEFVAVLASIGSEDDCVLLAQRLLQACRQPVLLGSLRMQVSVSIGAAVFPKPEPRPDHLLRQADNAMYLAKKAGKNGYFLAQQEVDAADLAD